jgi:1,2-diacylglycerol 3-beta-galactosyltransferase
MAARLMTGGRQDCHPEPMPETDHAGVTAAAPRPARRPLHGPVSGAGALPVPGSGTQPALGAGTQPAPGAGTQPMPLLFLIADTGGGHRSAARAVSQALDRAYPGVFAPALCDPLSGPGSARLLRWVTGLYGPAIRLAPWLWGAAFHACDSARVMNLLERTLLRLADGPALAAARAHRPVAVVSFHPLTGGAAIAARSQSAPGAVAVTVVTDLATMHAAWRRDGLDLIIAPRAARAAPGQPGRRADGQPGSAAGRRSRRTPGQPDRRAPGRPDRRAPGQPGRYGPDHRSCRAPGPADGPAAARYRPITAGPPVTRDFWAGPVGRGERASLRRSLGAPAAGFLILLTGGGEGSGPIAGQAAAILRRFTDVHVVAVCGRNQRLRRRLDRLAARAGHRDGAGGRLTVLGFTGSMGGWLRCADLVVTKAGPGTIAEAACCGTPLLLTAQLPGQERGNAEVVTAAGAGLRVRGVRPLLAEIARLRADPSALDSMRAAAARLGQPGDADAIAGHLARLVQARQAVPQTPPQTAPQTPLQTAPRTPRTPPQAAPGVPTGAGPGAAPWRRAVRAGAREAAAR